MTVAIWIIAICSLVRIIQNGIQLSLLLGERDMRKRLNNEFIDSLRKDNMEWVEDTLNDFIAKHREEFEAEQTDCAWNNPQMYDNYRDYEYDKALEQMEREEQ